MAKNFPVLFTAAGILAYAYMSRPDDKAPEGAKFKPDGKYKGTIVLDGDTDMSEFEAKAREAIEAEFGELLEDLHFPWKDGENRGEEFIGKLLLTAKTSKQPETFDGRGKKVPRGVFAKSGDTVKFKVALVPFEKIEKVKDPKTKKVVDEKMQGVSARLYGVQIIAKGSSGSGGGFADEGGYEASEDDAPETSDRGGGTSRNTGGDDDADF